VLDPGVAVGDVYVLDTCRSNGPAHLSAEVGFSVSYGMTADEGFELDLRHLPCACIESNISIAIRTRFERGTHQNPLV
jgi:hypothetical protein